MKRDRQLMHLRINRDLHMALKRWALESGLNINELVNATMKQVVPKKYYDPYGKKNQ